MTGEEMTVARVTAAADHLSYQNYWAKPRQTALVVTLVGDNRSLVQSHMCHVPRSDFERRSKEWIRAARRLRHHCQMLRLILFLRLAQSAEQYNDETLGG